MVKRMSCSDVVLELPPEAPSKQMAIYDALREAIASGAIGANQKLPSTREIARMHNVSRGTAVIAYELLEAEGYIVGRRGAGTFTAGSLPDDPLLKPNSIIRLESRRTAARDNVRTPAQALSQLGHRVASAPLPIGNAAQRCVPFFPYRPALDEFPTDLWAKLSAKHTRLASASLLADGHAAGFPRLRMAIADYLKATRGIQCSYEQIILTPGMQHSLLLCVQLLTNPGDRVLFEDPGYPGALAALQVAGMEVVPARVDGHGITLDSVEQGDAPFKLVYVTPAHQCPSGVVMSLERRRALRDWALRENAWIFEDDYDSDFRYCGNRLPSLYGMDNGTCVLHAGTFSKSLFPALRISYLVVPQPLVEAFYRAQVLHGRYPAILPQLVLCDFIESGHFARHIRRMIVCYQERRAGLIDALNEHFGNSIEIEPGQSGLTLTVWWGPGRDAQMISAAARKQSLHVEPTTTFQIRNPVRPGALLGFGGFTVPALRDGVRRLAKVVDNDLRGRFDTLARSTASLS